MYLTPTAKHWACDIEADGLLEEATRIWCVCLENCVTGEKMEFVNADSFASWMAANPGIVLVGHNFIAYDLVMLNRFWKAGIPISRVVDTFVLSQVFNPTYPSPAGLVAANKLKPKKERKGPHSLEAWGYRLGKLKTEYNDFSRLTPGMIEYCANDTSLAALLFRKLSQRMRQVGFSEDGCEIEHLAWNIIQNKQRRNGFPLNKRKAERLLIELQARERELRDEIFRLWPPQLCVVGEYKKSHKINGEPTKDFERHCEQYPRVQPDKSGGYRVYDYVEFNLGSSEQRIAKLLELGWTPSKFTKKTPKGGGGNPQVDEDELLAFAESSGTPELVALAKWLVVSSRAKNIITWLEALNEKTGAIHGKLFIASTLRYRHSQPNSANIPAVKTAKNSDGEDYVLLGEDGAWAYECRDLFDCGDPSEWTLVGLDGTGIQNRCLIHNLIKLIGEERVAPFRDLSLLGDIHKRNIDVLGLANKAAAKKFYYTLMMGGGGGRLAADQAQFGTIMTAKEGDEKKRALIATIPGFDELIKFLKAQREQTGGRIILCDNTPILVPSDHMVIPYLLQGDESRLMKRAMIYTEQEVRKARLMDHVFKVADIHDEWQYRVRNPYVRQFIDIALPCFNRAGKSFNYLIPIDGDAKIGKTWAETH